MLKPEEFDVCFSFAGEDREYVEEVAFCLKKERVKLFYDKYEEVTLWGKDLYEHLADVYTNKARYCVIFISSYYVEKLWTTHERKSAQERAFNDSKEYILPVRFDNTPIPGLRDTVGYLELSDKTPNELVRMILAKVRQEHSEDERHEERIGLEINSASISVDEKNEPNYVPDPWALKCSKCGRGMTFGDGTYLCRVCDLGRLELTPFRRGT